MATPAAGDRGFTAASYFELVHHGLLDESDHTELLEGLVVSAPPQGPLHASVTMAVDAALREAVGARASIRVQMPLVLGSSSVPEPDVAVVAGKPVDYMEGHPASALLVVEVAESSLPQDRLTKSRIYARAGIPEYWIVNLRDRCVEVFTDPDGERRVYRENRRVIPGDTIVPGALGGVAVAVVSLLPSY